MDSKNDSKHGIHGGSIREAGGSLGEYAAAMEERYFKQQDEKLINDMAEKIKNNQPSKAENEPFNQKI